MKRKMVVGVFAALVLLLSGLAAPAEDLGSWREIDKIYIKILKGTLGNLKELGILVQIGKVGPKVEKLGLTEEGLADEILVQLRAKLPRLKIVVGKPILREFLYIRVTIGELPGGGHYGNVLLQMKREVTVTATAEFTKASVWSDSMIFRGRPGSAPRLVREIIGELVTKFAAEYYTAGNP